MQRIFNRLMTRKVSTKLVDDMPSGIAVTALDKRVNNMLLMHALQPAAKPQQFSVLTNPLQNS